MALAAVHARHASLARCLGVRVLVRLASPAAGVAASSASLLYLVEAVTDGLEGSKDNVLIVGSELIRHIGGRLVAFDQICRGAAVVGALVHRRLDGGGEVSPLNVHLGANVLVGRL